MSVEANLDLLMRHAHNGRIVIERICRGQVKVSFEADVESMAVVLDAGGEVVGELPSTVTRYAVAAPTPAAAIVVLADCARRRGLR